MKRFWMDTETYDGSAHRAHPVKDSDGDWVRYEDAQSEIERLQTELEALHEQNRALLDDQISCACGYDSPDDVCGKHHPAFKRKIATARADALEEAAQAISKGAWGLSVNGACDLIRALIEKDQPK